MVNKRFLTPKEKGLLSDGDLDFRTEPGPEAIRAGRLIHKIVLPKQAQLRTKSGDVLHTIKQRAAQAGILVEYVDRVLDELVPGQNHQGVIAVVEPFLIPLLMSSSSIWARGKHLW